MRQQLADAGLALSALDYPLARLRMSGGFGERPGNGHYPPQTLRRRDRASASGDMDGLGLYFGLHRHGAKSDAMLAPPRGATSAGASRDVDAGEDPDDQARQADTRLPAAAVRAVVLADEAVARERDVIDGR